MQTRFSKNELDAVAAARRTYPKLSQRQLAFDIAHGRIQFGAELLFRTKSSIYGAIRRYDRNNAVKTTTTRRRNAFATA